MIKFMFKKEERDAKGFKLKEKYRRDKNKLIMTLLVKDEVDIIRQNILFHKAMGVDGIIVTDNDSTDGTLEILEELKHQGHILELIKEPQKDYLQDQWVDRMIKLAKAKYKATWVINSDADEFWYSKSLDLKKDVLDCAKDYANVLKVYQKDYIPITDASDFLSQTYFKLRLQNLFETENLKVKNVVYWTEAMEKKIIHKTAGYRSIKQGNHDVVINKKKEVFCPFINLYHYPIRNYKHFEKKVINGGKAYENHPDKGLGIHWRNWYEMYKQGELREEYDSLFYAERKEDLIKSGAVYQDSAVINFLKHKSII